MAKVGVSLSFWSGKRVLITGHTGFVGSWLTMVLQSLGAIVHGYSNDIPTDPSLFEIANLGNEIEWTLADIRDLEALGAAVKSVEPQVILHLAAQPLVRKSYTAPLDTFTTNILGVVNLLEVIRKLDFRVAVVNMTSDKCYKRSSQSKPYNEDAPLGGADPYSSSKACSELISYAYRSSYFCSKNGSNSNSALSTVRAGNIIGGGDWAKDRLMPDCVRAFSESRSIELRYPNAIRPWQHILDVIYGILVIAELTHAKGSQAADAWNIGPDSSEMWSVESVVSLSASLWGEGQSWHSQSPDGFKEENFLVLNNAKAKHELGWRPMLHTEVAIRKTIDWYKNYINNSKQVGSYTREEIRNYFEKLDE